MGSGTRCPRNTLPLADHSAVDAPGQQSLGAFFVGKLPEVTEGPALERTIMTMATTPSNQSAESQPIDPDLDQSLDIIPMLRTQIDAMDTAIIRLVTERTRLSKRIQAARISSGGTRVELGRERIVLDGYRAGLGPDGPQLAEAILRVGRGAR